MALQETKPPYRYTRHKPVIVPADREQGYGDPVIPGHDQYHVESPHTADQSADDHATGDAITVKGRRTIILAKTLFGG